ncbi:MAG: MFS transporter [Ilumatobacteraceae bacterium]
MPRARRTELVALTGAKVVSNTALRWVGPFLPTLERAFSTTTGTLTGVMGICELGGLTTVATGPSLDRGHERRVFTLGLVAVAVSSLIALAGTVPAFAVSFLVLILGVSNLTVAGHAWIGHRVPFAARGRAIGAFETSWAIALLAGAPLLAALIAWVGWRGPYVALAVGAVVAAVVVLRLVGADAPHLAERPAAARASLPARRGRRWSARPSRLPPASARSSCRAHGSMTPTACRPVGSASWRRCSAWSNWCRRPPSRPTATGSAPDDRSSPGSWSSSSASPPCCRPATAERSPSPGCSSCSPGSSTASCRRSPSSPKRRPSVAGRSG